MAFWVPKIFPKLNAYASRIDLNTGGVSYTFGGLGFAPPAWCFCFATPTFVRFSDFLALKRWCIALAMQMSYLSTFRHQVLVFIP